MKTFLALVALLSVTLPAGAAIVETFGVTLPALISMETGLGVFVAAFALMMFGAAYAESRTVDGRPGEPTAKPSWPKRGVSRRPVVQQRPVRRGRSAAVVVR